MIATFASTSVSCVHQHGREVIGTWGDAYIYHFVFQYTIYNTQITIYKITFNRKVNVTCFLDLPAKAPRNAQLKFLRIINRILIPIGPKIQCKDHPAYTYLQDINHEQFHISANGIISREKAKKDTVKPEKVTVFNPLRG